MATVKVIKNTNKKKKEFERGVVGNNTFLLTQNEVLELLNGKCLVVTETNNLVTYISIKESK